MDRAWAKDTRRSPGVKKVMSLVDGKSRRLSEFVEVRCVWMVFGVLGPFGLAGAGVKAAQEGMEKGRRGVCRLCIWNVRGWRGDQGE
jgi:hypothetical protein